MKWKLGRAEVTVGAAPPEAVEEHYAGRPLMFLTDLYVPPSWRGTGVASALLRRAARQADEQGWDLWLYCKAHGRRPRLNNAQLELFYEQHGFKTQRTSPEVEMVRRCAAQKPE